MITKKYYKAFFKPRGMWEKWAPLIRKKAGLGIINQQLEPDYYDKQYKFYDVVVVRYSYTLRGEQVLVVVVVVVHFRFQCVDDVDVDDLMSCHG